MLSSVTQSGNPVRATPLGSIHEPEDEVPLVRFCHPFEFQLLSPEMSLTTAWPVLYFLVISFYLCGYKRLDSF